MTELFFQRILRALKADLLVAIELDKDGGRNR